MYGDIIFVTLRLCKKELITMFGDIIFVTLRLGKKKLITIEDIIFFSFSSYVGICQSL